MEISYMTADFRDNEESYRAFRHVVLMVIELIRQFYDIPRCFRIS